MFINISSGETISAWLWLLIFQTFGLVLNQMLNLLRCFVIF